MKNKILRKKRNIDSSDNEISEHNNFKSRKITKK